MTRPAGPKSSTPYRAELAGHRAEPDQIRAGATKGVVTLIHAAQDEVHNDAIVLRDVLLGDGDG